MLRVQYHRLLLIESTNHHDYHSLDKLESELVVRSVASNGNITEKNKDHRYSVAAK